MSDIRNVVVLGVRDVPATGLVGKEIVKALLDDGSFYVTIVRRIGGSSSRPFPESSRLREVGDVDYSSVNSLKKAFEGQHAVVEALNPSGVVHQDKIVQAAVETESVRHIITPDFSGNYLNEHIHELRIYDDKVEAHKVTKQLIQQRDSLHWTAILTGAFFDWAIDNGIFWVDAKARQVTIFGSGNQRNAYAALDVVGRATIRVLKDPKAYQDRQAYFADYIISCNDLLNTLNELEYQTWTAKNVSLDDFYEQGKKLWDEDTAKGVQDRRSTMGYIMLGTYGCFNEEDRYSTDYTGRVEPGFGWTRDQFAQELQKAIDKARQE
ncbi:uncharacterized protein TRUGW13939_04799 [Talaromyces rugulosus]|uniref:NAD(P)-binding domain-containing protein n=1 Tax=Talaromyces rugulosus TaxID=121627 RepID=A0A7H8QVY9_TALRU|nr:uncharacterized protein TRUGW13939_04799 [Talaromyces rugulosus]QKX57681.1 hypothetical protein TRUGW13939_04799 [Talaromyces rugulosus]